MEQEERVVTVATDGSGNATEFFVSCIIEENNYYPFGLKHSGYNEGGFEASKYKGKFNGKEYQDELGLNVYDYHARNYDAALGKWMNVDPLAEVSRRWSPYTYGYNNPVRFTDPDGMLAMDQVGLSDRERDILGMNDLSDREDRKKAFDSFVNGGSSRDGEFGYWDKRFIGNEAIIIPDFDNSFQTLSQVNLIPLYEYIFVSTVGQPGAWESAIPIWGSGRSAYDHFQRGNYWRGIGYSALAISDVFLVKAAVTAIGKGIAVGVSKVAAEEVTEALVTTGTQWSSHSLLRLAERGVTKKMAETAIRKGQKFYDPLNNSINYVLSNGFASGKSLLVGTNPLTGEVTTVIRSSKNLIKKRMVPIK